jgi:glycosyltransferase involved in cell wall biosynthesis
LHRVEPCPSGLCGSASPRSGAIASNRQSFTPEKHRMSSTPPQRDGDAGPRARLGQWVKPLLLCLSHLRWDFVFQRPQHLMVRAARDYDVLFVEEPMDDSTGAARMSLSPRASGVVVATPHLPPGLGAEAVLAAQRALLDEALAPHAGRPLVAWFYTPMALGFASHLKPSVTVWDCMDELSAFRGAPQRMRDMEAEMLSRADVVFTGGRSLYEAKLGRHPNLHCFPSSIDAAHFARARAAQPDPGDQAGIGRPRIGFFGVVDERMDVGLVDALAALRPDWQFVMVGPVVKIDPATLPRRPNLHWLGPKRYEELPFHLSGWDLGFMPFALNESTRFISPTKTPEFLAAGLPVVSTPVVDVVRDYGEAGLVEIASGPDAFAEKLQAILARPRVAWLERVDRRLAETSWDRTWEAMRRALLRAPAAAARAAPFPADGAPSRRAPAGSQARNALHV